MMDVQFTLNGAPRRIECAPGDTLLAVLRREGCFSVRFGSSTGETGAAAVLLDGRLISAPCEISICSPKARRHKRR